MPWQTRARAENFAKGSPAIDASCRPPSQRTEARERAESEIDDCKAKLERKEAEGGDVVVANATEDLERKLLRHKAKHQEKL